MSSERMKIGIIGAGRVGATLGRKWAATGHEVKFGVRRPPDAKTRRLLEEVGEKASTGTVAEAAAFADVVVLATPWAAAEAAIASAGDLKGKVLLDCINPLKEDLSGLELGHTTSGAERVAALAPGARVVKIFNTTGSDNMANPQYGDRKVTMLYAGDDVDAKATAATLAREVGFEPVDLGPLSAARLLEPFAMLWITLAYSGMGTDFALQILRRS